MRRCLTEEQRTQLPTTKKALSVHEGEMSTPYNISPGRDAQISLDNGSNKNFHWQISIAASGNLKLKRNMGPQASQKENRHGFAGQHEFLLLAKGTEQRSGMEIPATQPGSVSR